MTSSLIVEEVDLGGFPEIADKHAVEGLSREFLGGMYQMTSTGHAQGVLRDSGFEGRANALREKSTPFAIDCGRICLKLCAERATYSVGDQLLRSSASVGANVAEANGAYSVRDFALKISIAYKEARESRFWLQYSNGLDLVTPAQYHDLFTRAEELIRILGKITSTLRSRYPRKKT